METMTALVDLTTNEFIQDGSAAEDGVRYVRKPVTVQPNGRTQKYAGDPTVFAAKTAPEIATFDTARQTARAALTSRERDLLTTCLCAVRGRNIPAWNAMTLAAKKTAVLAEADLWRDMRVWIEVNL